MKVISKEAKFLKAFSGIKVGKICREYGIDVSNLQKGRASEEKEIKVYNRVIKEILMLFANTIFDDQMEIIEWQRK